MYLDRLLSATLWFSDCHLQKGDDHIVEHILSQDTVRSKSRLKLVFVQSQSTSMTGYLRMPCIAGELDDFIHSEHAHSV